MNEKETIVIKHCSQCQFMNTSKFGMKWNCYILKGAEIFLNLGQEPVGEELENGYKHYIPKICIMQTLETNDKIFKWERICDNENILV